MFIALKVEGHSRDTSDRIEEALTGHPGGGRLLPGLRRGATSWSRPPCPTWPRYEQLLLGQILAIPSVTEAHSTFAIRTILCRGPIPLDHWR